MRLDVIEHLVCIRCGWHHLQKLLNILSTQNSNIGLTGIFHITNRAFARHQAHHNRLDFWHTGPTRLQSVSNVQCPLGQFPQLAFVVQGPSRALHHQDVPVFAESHKIGAVSQDEQKLKVMEKEQTILAMQKQIEDLKRRAEQGSQQLQGEVQEMDLENLLRMKFPFDSIEPVAKGEFGGDVLQRVISQTGQPSGAILWESKRTKNWSDGWLTKLRDDQRTAKAEISILVSQALPKGVETFDVIDGVWVTSPRAALAVAMVMRHSLLQVSMARQAHEGQQTKTEMVYQYLTGPRFRHRVEAIVEAFSSMKEDLDKERKVIMKQWAKREEQIERVMGATVGMYGDLQGIAGKTLQEIEGLSLVALPGPDEEGGGDKS